MAAPEFQFWVGLSSTLARVQRITKISSVNLQLQLNSGGTLSMTVDRSDGATQFLALPLSYCLMIYRGGYLVWSGPLWTVDETYSGESRKLNITAVGWYELLNHRLIRTQPGYQLITSPITWSNGTYEAAISGFTLFRATATRDTAVFRSGAGSLLFGENQTGPFGEGIDNGNEDMYITNTPLSATPTAGKRYKLNFYARGRKTPSDVGCFIPYVEVLESGNRVGYLQFSSCYNTATWVNHFSNGGWTDSTTSIPGAGTSTGTFVAQSLEWVSNGTTPTFKFYADGNPSQSINPDCTSTAGWTPSGTTYITSASGLMYFNNDAASNILGVHQAWTGTFTSGKVYKLIVRTYDISGQITSGSFVKVFDGTLAGTELGSVNISNTIGWTTSSLTWTATVSPPVVQINANFGNGATGQLLLMEYMIVQENANDTDPILNVDDVTLQEYNGDGIYSNLDAGAIAIALLNKANSDGATKIVPGTVQTTQLRTRTYQQFSNVGKEIKALSDIEAGYDIWVDPTTRAMNIYNRTSAANFPALPSGGQAGASSAFTYSANRTGSLRFDYGCGLDNLSTFKRTKDSSVVVNRLNVQGKYALGFAQDTTSQVNYGIFEDLISLPDVVDATTSSVLPYYANAEIAFRKNPKIIYDIQTKPGDNTPKLFIDFNIGDRGMINVGPNIVAGGSAIQQAIRIFGIQMNVDAEGNERLSGLQLSDNN